MNTGTLTRFVQLTAALSLASLLVPGIAEARKHHKSSSDSQDTQDISATGSLPKDPPPYVGVWAKDAEACKVSAGTDKAPLVLKPRRLMQYETDCGLSDVQSAGKLWTANATCKVQGDKQRHSLMMTVEGDSMEYGWDSPKGDKLIRCKLSG